MRGNNREIDVYVDTLSPAHSESRENAVADSRRDIVGSQEPKRYGISCQRSIPIDIRVPPQK